MRWNFTQGQPKIFIERKIRSLIFFFFFFFNSIIKLIVIWTDIFTPRVCKILMRMVSPWKLNAMTRHLSIDCFEREKLGKEGESAPLLAEIKTNMAAC